MKERKSEILVGVFALAGTTVLMVMIVLFGNITDLFKDTYDVLVYFDNARGVRPGVAVTMAGVPVGWVDEIELGEREGVMKVEMRLKIRSEVRIRRGAIFAIKSEGLIANPKIDIRQKPIGRAETANLMPRTGDPGKVDGKPTPNIEEVFERIIVFADKLEQFMGDEKNRMSFEQAIRNVEIFTDRLVQATGGDAPSDVRTALENLRKFTASANELIADGRKFTGMMHRMTEKNQESLHRLVDSMVANSRRIDRALENLDVILAQVAEGRGSVGKLLKDKEAYAELLQVLKGARTSLEEMRGLIKHLKDNVNFSIF